MLRRYRNVADMLRDYIPSCVGKSCSGSGDDATTSSSSCSSGVGRESKELYAIMSMPLVNGIWLLVAWEEHHPPNPPTSISQLTMRAARLGRERGNGARRSAPAAPAAAKSRCDAVCRLRGRPQRTPATGGAASRRVGAGRRGAGEARRAAGALRCDGPSNQPDTRRRWRRGGGPGRRGCREGVGTGGRR